MKKSGWIQSLRFFTEWAVETVVQQKKNVAILGIVGSGAAYLGHENHAIHAHEEEFSPVQESAQEGSRAPASIPGEPSVKLSYDPMARGLSGTGNSGLQLDSSVSPPRPVVNTGTGFTGGGSVSAGYHLGSGDTASNEAKEKLKEESKKSDLNSGNDLVSPGVFNPLAAATSANGNSSGSVFSASGAVIPAAASAGAAGFQVVSGGGICTATGLQARVSIGALNSPVVQSGTGMLLISGLEGVLFQ